MAYRTRSRVHSSASPRSPAAAAARREEAARAHAPSSAPSGPRRTHNGDDDDARPYQSREDGQELVALADTAVAWWSQLSKLNATQLRHVYFTQYKIGSYARFMSGGREGEGYRLPRDRPLTILLYGPPGAGKSSLVNTLKRVIEDESDWNPIAPINDMDVGRDARTAQTRAYCLGNARAPELGRVEVWDSRGAWFPRRPELDFSNIHEYVTGKLGPGYVPTAVLEKMGRTPEEWERELLKMQRPVGSGAKRPVDLVVFVINPSLREHQEHLKKLVSMMNRVDYAYQIVLTSPDDYCGSTDASGRPAWSNFDPERRVKLPLVSADETWCIENFKFDRPQRTRESDRNVLFVWFKLLLAAERSLLSEKRPAPARASADAQRYLLFVVPGVLVALTLLILAVFKSY